MATATRHPVKLPTELAQMIGHYQLGAWDSLEDMAQKLVKAWGEDFLMPPRERGESDKKYNQKVEKVAKDNYHRVARKVQGMLSSAMRGNSAILRSEGIHLGDDGARITIPTEEGKVNADNKKQDWVLPSATY